MKKIHQLLCACVLIPGSLFTSSAFCQSQKNIVLSQNLETNSEKLNVKMGTQWMGKIWNIRFGEYAVVSSKMGWTTTSYKAKLFNRKTESASKGKFSFVLNNKTADSARVNAATYVLTQYLRDIELLPNLSLAGSLLKDSSNFSSFVTFNGDTTETWLLSMIITKGRHTARDYEGLLTNGEREILIMETTSNKNGEDTRRIPAYGFEFIENGQSLCALQYYAGGAFGMNKNVVWMGNQHDNKMKLLLAAAMTAILQVTYDLIDATN